MIVCVYMPSLEIEVDLKNLQYILPKRFFFYTLGETRGGSRIFCTLVKIFVAIKQGGITYFFRGEVGVICD